MDAREALARMEIDLSLPLWMDDKPSVRAMLCDVAGPDWPSVLPGEPT